MKKERIKVEKNAVRRRFFGKSGEKKGDIDRIGL